MNVTLTKRFRKEAADMLVTFHFRIVFLPVLSYNLNIKMYTAVILPVVFMGMKKFRSL
jgi:hypothetical protein